ncbi:MAG: ATP-binding cassette domain-containing protein, partial [Nitrososphaerota archaeon]|nr:ATP-binding cassette domain-containing protein [Nitrososphaerota archaeon]
MMEPIQGRPTQTGGRAVAIEAENLTKLYPPGIRAVDDVTFAVEEGEVFGLLGPNGAGKTTMIKMVTTLSRPTSGALRVFGEDVLESPEKVRSMLGYVPQNVSVDADLTGYENLLIFAKLFYVGREDRKKRIKEALQYMGLAERANELVRHYSGGMMRRLEIAQALVNRPRILFLDEPSIGLDPSSRRQLWSSVRQLNSEFGTTIIITTHDMEEADELCGRIAIMDAGKIAVMGSPASLKESVGGDLVNVKLAQAETVELPRELGIVVNRDSTTIQLMVKYGNEDIPRIIEFLSEKGIHAESVSVSRPTLDDVFLKYTQKHLDSGSFAGARAARRSF